MTRTFVAANLTVLTTCVLFGQAPASPPEFDVAAIKLAPPQAEGHTDTRMSVYNSSGERNGTLNYTNVSLKEVLGKAYQVQQYQITGGPTWLGSVRFNIAAVIPAGATREQVPLMLQRLLADRFSLRLHHESKELPVYALTVGKNGSKLKPAESETGITSNSNRTHWHVTAKTSMSGFTEFLSIQLDRPVLDATGLSGTFDITLDWTSDVAQPGTNEAAAGPSIFTAVQEQLGLKLEARKGPVDMLVIDRAEKPSDN